MKKIFIIILFTIFFTTSYSQTYPKNDKIKKIFDKAVHALYYQDTALADDYCDKIIKKDPNYTEPYILKAQILFYKQKYDDAFIFLDKVLKLDSNYTDIFYLKGFYRYTEQKYADAIPFFEKYITLETDTNAINNANEKIELCNFRINAINNPIPFNPTRFNNNINTTAGEYFPTISADNNAIVFTRLKNKQEDIFICRKIDGKWNKAVGVSHYINSSANEGAHTLSADGMTMIFTRCIENIGCNLYISNKDKSGFWMPPEPLYNVNSRYWDSQPCLSPDGKTLYFTSTRPGGKGKMDIWASDKINNQWTKPYNLGDSINSPGQEMSPFIHFDNKTLYYSSNYFLGMGGYDLFMSRKINDTTWAAPKNLGYPINTISDEFRIVVDASGKYGYFSSSRDTTYKQDIYYFPLPASIKPERTIYVKAQIYSIPANTPIKADSISIINLNDNSTTFTENSSSHFLICLPENNEYALNIVKKDYLFYSDNFDLKNIPDSVNHYDIEIYLTPILKNTKITLKNIFFETDSYKINPKSYVELNKLASFLKINPNLIIQINGHTDSIGSYNYNIELSKNRAKSIMQYLISKGINENRITFKGYGYSIPIANNQTVDGRKLNRRTEVVIIRK